MIPAKPIHTGITDAGYTSIPWLLTLFRLRDPSARSTSLRMTHKESGTPLCEIIPKREMLKHTRNLFAKFHRPHILPYG